ncbi:hypothetical protein ACH5RR_030346 [Cinchona calisaya]|uniref:Uncharacterized protein n=1 Tax=Cinchona calisaya TaxID=153742 RepID=A0ABD2YXT7_9GENT
MDDSSENLGGSEECSSSESGWTMYIASPIHDNNPEDDDEEGNDNSTERKEYKDFQEDGGGDAESDDSMASDASSGPSHQGGLRRDDLEHAGSKVNRISSGKKHDKQVEKNRYAAETKAVKEDQGNKGKSASDNVHSKGKSRKNK